MYSEPLFLLQVNIFVALFMLCSFDGLASVFSTNIWKGLNSLVNRPNRNPDAYWFIFWHKICKLSSTNNFFHRTSWVPVVKVTKKNTLIDSQNMNETKLCDDIQIYIFIPCRQVKFWYSLNNSLFQIFIPNIYNQLLNCVN